jgi:uncharacterized delta-60 repeat protein
MGARSALYRGAMREMRIALVTVAAATLLVATGSESALAKQKKIVKVAPRGTVVSRSTLAWDVAMQPDGKVVTVGRSGGRRLRVVVARRLDNGQLDPTFGRRIVAVAPKALIYRVAIQPDGGILIAGEAPGTGMSADGSPSDFILARLLPSGQLDPSFGSAGVVRTDFGADDAPAALTMQDDGRILLAGHADRGYPDRANPDSSFALARYTPSGALDGSFGAGGKALISFGQFNAALDLSVRSDGKIAVAGYNQFDPGSNDPENLAQARLNSDGSLDPSFGAGGKLVTQFFPPGERVSVFGVPQQISALTYTGDGRLIAVGDVSVFRHRKVLSRTKVERFTVDGSPDPTFGVAGQILLGAAAGQITGARTTPDGATVLSGSDEGVRVTRLTPSGFLDRIFARRGTAFTRLPGGVEEFSVIAFDSLGRTLVAGQTDAGRGLLSVIARYLPSGRLDKTFGPRHKRGHRKHPRRRGRRASVTSSP